MWIESSCARRRLASSSASFQGLGRDGGVMGEVEAKPAGCHQRTRLSRVVTQDVLEGPMHDVRRRMRARGCLSALSVDHGVRALTCPHLAGLHHADVHDRMRARRHGVGDPHESGVGSDDALVADLAAALGVERGPVQEQAYLLPFLRAVQLFARVVEQERDRSFGVGLLVAHELGGRHGARFEPDLDLLAGAPGTFTLRLQELGEPIEVHREARLGGPFLDLFARDPEGVRQRERILARDRRVRRAALRLLEQADPLVEGRRETLLLGCDDLSDERLVLAQFGVGVAEPVDHGRDDGVEHGALDPEPATV